MNSPFAVPLGLWESPKPDELWSLWDMAVNFHFNSVCFLLRELRVLVGMSNHNMNLSASPFRAVGDQEKEIKAMDEAAELARAMADLSKNLFSSLKCGHIDNAGKFLRHWADNTPRKWSELNTRARSLRDAIETELKEYLHFQYPRDKGQKFKSWMEDWGHQLKAFPDIKLDVFSATDCFALGHDTASVFHSMRVAEYGLRALARERRITLPKGKLLEWGNWQEIIKALDDEIRIIGSKKAGPTKDAALEFYSGARADLNGFKDEYRNLVMHVRATYDEHQALRALEKVRAFMERVASKIDHTHKPIKWGRF